MLTEVESVTSRPLRLALVSVGLGRVRRGFERYFNDLFQVLRDDLDVTLFKSGGPRNHRERVPRLLGLTTSLVRKLTPRRLGGAEYHRDCLAFALVLAPEIRLGRYDVVHVIDPPLAVALAHLRRVSGMRAKLLFTEGTAMPPEYYPEVDHLHHVALTSFERAVVAGIPPTRMSLVPCGLHAAGFQPSAGRDELRRRYHVSRDAFVVLVVSAVKREHKRVDHVIHEVSRLGGNVLLWIDGNPEDASVPELARERLGERCRITHVSSHELSDLYHLADVLVQASLSESFGLAIVEALTTELPALAHDTRHFEWLLGDRSALVDMQQPGALAQRLEELRRCPEASKRAAVLASRAIRRRFDWTEVKAAYLEMYRRVAAGDGTEKERNRVPA